MLIIRQDGPQLSIETFRAAAASTNNKDGIAKEPPTFIYWFKTPDAEPGILFSMKNCSLGPEFLQLTSITPHIGNSTVTTGTGAYV